MIIIESILVPYYHHTPDLSRCSTRRVYPGDQLNAVVVPVYKNVDLRLFLYVLFSLRPTVASVIDRTARDFEIVYSSKVAPNVA